MAIKVAGIHWWYKSRSHAAEMTAGYYNHLKRDGYAPIANMLAKRGVGLSFTCIEMSDDENPDPRHCSPQGARKTLSPPLLPTLNCPSSQCQFLSDRHALSERAIKRSVYFSVLFKAERPPFRTPLFHVKWALWRGCIHCKLGLCSVASVSQAAGSSAEVVHRTCACM